MHIYKVRKDQDGAPIMRVPDAKVGDYYHVSERSPDGVIIITQIVMPPDLQSRVKSELDHIPSIQPLNAQRFDLRGGK